MQVHYDEGVASHIGPEPCAGIREGVGEAGSVANSRGLAELLILDGNAGLCGEDGELLGEGRIWIEGESRLSFAHHVNHFDAG